MSLRFQPQDNPCLFSTSHMTGQPEFLAHLPPQMPCPRGRFQGWLLSPLLSCLLNSTHALQSPWWLGWCPLHAGDSCWSCCAPLSRRACAVGVLASRGALHGSPLAWVHRSHLPHSFRSLVLLCPFPAPQPHIHKFERHAFHIFIKPLMKYREREQGELCSLKLPLKRPQMPLATFVPNFSKCPC